MGFPSRFLSQRQMKQGSALVAAQWVPAGATYSIVTSGLCLRKSCGIDGMLLFSRFLWCQ